jgi:phosphatidylglycerophosphate synthase
MWLVKKTKRPSLFYFINGLTIARLILSPIVFYLILSEQKILALFIFLIGVVTDILDGALARHFKLTSEFGKDFDLVADTFLQLGAVVPLMILDRFTSLVEGFIFFIILFLALGISEYSIKNKKLTMPGRRPSTTINSYFLYLGLALFIVDSPFKFIVFCSAVLVLFITIFDRFFCKEK